MTPPLAMPQRPATGWAVDSHAHVLDPQRFALGNPQGYRPQPNECGTPAEYAVVLAAHGLSHALLVNPFAGYGLDNRCMLDAIERSGGRFRGVALVGHDTSDRELQELSAAGVVGARFNTLFSGATSLEGAAGERLLARTASWAGSPRSTSTTTRSCACCRCCCGLASGW